MDFREKEEGGGERGQRGEKLNENKPWVSYYPPLKDEVRVLGKCCTVCFGQSSGDRKDIPRKGR